MEENIAIKSLIIETAKMRKAQREFFATHSSTTLEKAKGFEKSVDNMLRSFIIQGNNVFYQPSIF